MKVERFTIAPDPLDPLDVIHRQSVNATERTHASGEKEAGSWQSRQADRQSALVRAQAFEHFSHGQSGSDRDQG